MKLSYLWSAPEVNPVNGKARSIPILNVWNVYGRVYFFSWFGFMVAFWAWYAFPPLITHVIKADLKLTPEQVANSNIVSLVATLFVRYLAGPLCDQFGPRRVFAGLLLTGAVPLGLAPLVHNATGLYASRFFIGIIGGSYVPCLVWCTAFFDKNVVGSANALAGGWGNAGGGITYFIMPAVFDSLRDRGYGIRQSWRITFVVPLVVVIATGVSMLICCPDTPTGKWSERRQRAEENLSALGVLASPEEDVEKNSTMTPSEMADKEKEKEKEREDTNSNNGNHRSHPAHYAQGDDRPVSVVSGEMIQKPTFRGIVKILMSPQTLFQFVTYFCSFGSELAIDAVLGAYYVAVFPGIAPTRAANLAAIFGFLNFVTRPAGGFISDLLYRRLGGAGAAGGVGSNNSSNMRSLWAKKALIVACGVIAGFLLIIIGTVEGNRTGGNVNTSMPAVLALITLAAVFIEAGNGANFGLVPHIHPWANGVVSGTTGAAGNFGGIIFSIIFRFSGDGTDYSRAFWIIGVITIVLNLILSWVPPIPKGQIGGL